MFKKVAQYYREGKAGKAIKLLKKILLDDAKGQKLSKKGGQSKKTPKKAAKKKSLTSS